MKLTEKAARELLKADIKNSADLVAAKRKIAVKYKTAIPRNTLLLRLYHKFTDKKIIKNRNILENLLRTKPIRSLSGIVNVSVLTKPYPCPGKCLYCPAQKGVPKSYLSNEPAVMRAIQNKYDPFKQTLTRIISLKNTGHPTDKIELRIIGGTWSFYKKDYQEWFIKRCFDACNGKKSKNLQEAQKTNEKTKHRIVGLSIETRPDFVNLEEIKRLRNLGVTMVEMGVQTIYNNVLSSNFRGHDIEKTILATRLLKDAGFKVLYQMMPNLPGASLKKDEEMFKQLFSDPAFQPDLLKIYPCALLKEAPLYKLWRKGKYKPYSAKNLITLVKKIKKTIPYYVRIQRITRDIPSQSIVIGPAKISNLRQIVMQNSEKEGWRCKCIRCREIKASFDPVEKIYLFREDYRASQGKEIFLSFENRKRTKIYSLLRLRIPESNCEKISPLLRDSALIREIHTYGQANLIGKNSSDSPQHRGLGKNLLKMTEKIAKKEFGLKRIFVISGVGARGYYRKNGYRLRDTYMVKEL